MSTTCAIEFENNPEKIVYAGQLLRGTVRLKLFEKINVRSVYIRISGKVLVRWHAAQVHLIPVYAIAEQIVLDERVQLTVETNGDVILEPGMHLYAFEFMLPSNIPSSIEVKFGHIRYTVQVVLDVPVWLNKKFKEQFTLINAINLNDDPSLRQPLIVEKTKALSPFCCICIESNPIKIIARTPVGGFIPGQIIPLEININNQSNIEISKFTVELMKLIIYSNQERHCGCRYGHKKLERESLHKLTGEGCRPNQDKIIRFSVEVPTTLSVNSVICKTIKLTYSIQIKALMPFLYRNLTIDFPLTIGSYPFHDDTIQQTDLDD